MQKYVYAAVIVLSVFLAGCVGTSNMSSESSGKIDIEKVRQLAGGNVQVSLIDMTALEVSQNFESLNESCAGLLEKKNYSVIEAKGEGVDMRLFVDEGRIVCSIKTESAKFGSCSSDSDCEDAFLSTIDICTGLPKKCTNERTAECIAGDMYCPVGCTKKTDSDCLRECNIDSECDDSDIRTNDVCSGLIKKCSNEKIIVAGREAISCSSDSECVSADSCENGFCSDGLCDFENRENGFVCKESKECFEGECVEPSVHPVIILTDEVFWVSENSVELKWKTNKLSTAQIHFGRLSSQLFPKKAQVKEAKTEHSFVLEKDSIQKGEKNFYRIIATGLQGITSSQTSLVEFTMCSSDCSDNDNCTLDYCDLADGACVNKKDPNNASC